jgi:hypothetical protein
LSPHVDFGPGRRYSLSPAGAKPFLDISSKTLLYLYSNELSEIISRVEALAKETFPGFSLYLILIIRRRAVLRKRALNYYKKRETDVKKHKQTKRTSSSKT